MTSNTLYQPTGGMATKENGIKEDFDLIELKQMLGQIGLVFEASHADLKKVCYENNPADSRLSLLHELMFRIHPEKAFWDVKSENELKANCLQVSRWFGLAANDDVAMGYGTRDEQKWFWKLLLQTVIDLENVDGMKPIDIDLVKHLDYIVLNSTVLQETLSNHKTANIVGDNSGESLVTNLLERIKLEITETEKKINDAEQDNKIRLGKAYMSTKTLRRKQNLSKTLASVQHDLGALLEKYKLLRPLTISGGSRGNNEDLKPECDMGKLTDTFAKIDKMVKEFKTFTELLHDQNHSE